MNYTITTNLWEQTYNFLISESKKRKTTKKAILEEALRNYEKNLLTQQIEEWLKERYNEYKTLNNEFSESQFNSLKD